MNTNHIEEQPLVSWGDIATYLKTTISSARRELKSKRIEVFTIGRCIAIYPSDLREQLEKHKKPIAERKTVSIVP